MDKEHDTSRYYTPPLTRLLFHAYSYTPTLTRLQVQSHSTGVTHRFWVTHRGSHIVFAYLPCIHALYTCCLCLSFDETCVEFSTFGREYIVYCAYESLILCHNYMLPNQTGYGFVQTRTKEIYRKKERLSRTKPVVRKVVALYYRLFPKMK
jgi:hypothetical protein